MRACVQMEPHRSCQLAMLAAGLAVAPVDVGRLLTRQPGTLLVVALVGVVTWPVLTTTAGVVSQVWGMDVKTSVGYAFLSATPWGGFRGRTA